MLRSHTLQLTRYQGPSAPVPLDHIEQFDILLKSPFSLFDIGVQMVDPFFPAHRERLKEPPLRFSEQTVRDRLPLRLVLFFPK